MNYVFYSAARGSYILKAKLYPNETFNNGLQILPEPRPFALPAHFLRLRHSVGPLNTKNTNKDDEAK